MLDLPPYGVRVSDRARNVRLTVTPRDGLVVVIPRRFPQARIPAIVAERREWVERALERVREHSEALKSRPSAPPAAILLPGIGERWTLMYAPSSSETVRASVSGSTLLLSGAVQDLEAVGAALRRFARGRASATLPDALSALAEEQSLPFTRVRIRSQRTRWGSCSSTGSISLNWRLALLPPDLARHVMLHELVHTQRLDHSASFHAQLAARQPDARRFERALKEAWRHVPWWAADG